MVNLNRYEVAYVVLLVIWAVSGVFITSANVKLGSYNNLDPYLNNAYWNTFAAAFVTWTLIGIIIILLILVYAGGVALFSSGIGEVGLAGVGAEEAVSKILLQETVNSLNNKLDEKNETIGATNKTLAILGISLFLVTVSGVLSAVSASQIVKSPNYSKDDKKLHAAYNDCIIGACLCLGSAGILLIVMITSLVSYKKAKDEQQELQAELEEKQRQHELEIEELKKKHLDSRIKEKARLEQAHRRSVLEYKIQEAKQREAIEQLKAEKEREALIQEAKYRETQLQATKNKDALEAAKQQIKLTEETGVKVPTKPVRKISTKPSEINDPIPLSNEN